MDAEINERMLIKLLTFCNEKPGLSNSNKRNSDP
jgi:hypothetical protein